MKTTKKLTEGNITKQLVEFSVPLFLTSLLQMVYNTVDMILVGHYTGEIGLSAISIGGDIISLLTLVAIGFSQAIQVLVAQDVGKQRADRAAKMAGNAIMFLGFLAVVLSVLGLVGHNTMMHLMNTPEEVWKQASAYSITCICGMIAVFVYNGVIALMRGMGDSVHPLYCGAAGAIINLVLDLVFVAVLRMSAFGAAIATVISQFVTAILSFAFLLSSSNPTRLELSAGDFRIERETCLKLLKLGIPMALKSASVRISKVMVNSWINAYGVTVSAVTGVGLRVNSIANLVSMALQTAASCMIAQNIGARKESRVKKIMLATFFIGAVVSVFTIGILCLFPRWVFSLFTIEEAVLKLATAFLPASVVAIIACTFRSPMFGLIHGSGKANMNFLVAILDGIVMRIGCALLLGIVCKMGYTGFWMGDAIAGFTPFLIGGVFYLSGKWKKTDEP